jgi:hypothetical protein
VPPGTITSVVKTFTLDGDPDRDRRERRLIVALPDVNRVTTHNLDLCAGAAIVTGCNRRPSGELLDSVTNFWVALLLAR